MKKDFEELNESEKDHVIPRRKNEDKISKDLTINEHRQIITIHLLESSNTSAIRLFIKN